MHGGPEGLTVAEIIDVANELGLTGDARWPLTKGKKSHISAVRCSRIHPRRACRLQHGATASTGSSPASLLMSTAQHVY